MLMTWEGSGRAQIRSGKSPPKFNPPFSCHLPSRAARSLCAIKDMANTLVQRHGLHFPPLSVDMVYSFKGLTLGQTRTGLPTPLFVAAEVFHSVAVP